MSREERLIGAGTTLVTRSDGGEHLRAAKTIEKLGHTFLD